MFDLVKHMAKTSVNKELIQSSNKIIELFSSIQSQSSYQLSTSENNDFSPALAEVYIREFDNKVKNINGLYFYKRYVDDIVLLVNPNMINIDKCWKDIQNIAEEQSLTLHDDDDKTVRIQLPTINKKLFCVFISFEKLDLER